MGKSVQCCAGKNSSVRMYPLPYILNIEQISTPSEAQVEDVPSISEVQDISFEGIIPLLKAEPRKATNRGKKPRRCMISTDLHDITQLQPINILATTQTSTNHMEHNRLRALD